MNLTPLPCYPWPLSETRLALLKAAKESLDLDYRIVPVEGVYESPGRILVFGDSPPFLCNMAPIRHENVDNVKSVAAALKYALEDRNDGRFGHASQLSKWMGVNVTLSHEEDEFGGVKFR